MGKMTIEELLNKLIEKGWKPTNRAKRGDVYKCEVRGIPGWVNVRFFIKGEEYGNYGMNLRELVSKESGLWQFVCENGFVPKDERVSWRKIDEDGDYMNHYSKYQEKGSDVGYRLIESSLKDESELEEFLLQNIKIDE